ncbi:MAG: transglutaminase family protein [Saprospiraceae bacterium]
MKRLPLLSFLLSIAFIVHGQDDIQYSIKKQVITVDAKNNTFTKKIQTSGSCAANQKHRANIYFGELQQIKNIKATYQANGKGKPKKVNKKNFSTSSVPTSSFYAGIQKTTIPFPDKEQPYSFSYSYEVENKDLIFLSSLHFWDISNTDTFNYKIILPTSHKLHYELNDSLSSCNLVDINKEVSNGNAIYSFTAIPQKDKVYPDEYFLNIRLIVTPEEKDPYDFFNDWYAELVAPNALLSEEIIMAIKAEVADKESDQKRIAAVFNLIKERTSYIDIENGIGAVMPRDVNKIWVAQQGDCKDMSNLLCQSLRSIGYDAKLALSATIGHSHDLDFPSLSSANHAICVLKQDGKWLFMDATEREGFFGFPSRQIQGKNIFVINNDVGEIVKVPKVKASDNIVVHKINLEKVGNTLTGTASYQYHGLSQIDLRSATKYIGSNRLEAALENHLEKQSSNLQYENIDLSLENKKCTINAIVASERNFTTIRKKNYLSLAFLPVPHSQEIEKEKTEANFYKTENQQFIINLTLGEPIKLQELNPVELNQLGISFTFNVVQKTPETIEINYQYLNNNLFLDDEKVKVFHQINSLIQETLKKSIIYENRT